MKALVIGGTRFFGKQLVLALLGQRADVTVLTRGHTPDPFGGQVERVTLDRNELNGATFTNERWDVVFDQQCYSSRQAEGACAAFRGRTDRYIFTSSQSVYDEGAALSESAFDPTTYYFDTPADPREDYSEAKRQAEAVFAQQAPFPVTMVRFPIVLGDDDYTRRLHFHVEHVRDSKPIFMPNPSAKISFVHAPNAGEFLSFLGTSDAAGPVNCCSPDAIVLSDLMRLIESATRRSAIIVDDPERGNPSPFGLEVDWYMDASRMAALGFTAPMLGEWLPALIGRLANKPSGVAP